MSAHMTQEGKQHEAVNAVASVTRQERGRVRILQLQQPLALPWRTTTKRSREQRCKEACHYCSTAITINLPCLKITTYNICLSPGVESLIKIKPDTKD